MTKHKWHKEIKAWADGAEIEYRDISSFDYVTWKKWEKASYPIEWDDSGEYRIKPQPIQPKYLYAIVFDGSEKVRLSTNTRLGENEFVMGKIEVQDD